MDLFAKREGVTLEPVYTGKAMAALLELNRAAPSATARSSTGTRTRKPRPELATKSRIGRLRPAAR